MCIASTPKAPEPAAVLPEAPTAPEAPVSATSTADRRRRAAARGRGGSGTILTSSRGVTQEGATTGKTLLGQ